MSGANEQVQAATDERHCVDCNTKHGQAYEKYSEWSWHFPHYEEMQNRSLGDLTADRAASLAWKYQQTKIDALRSRIAELTSANATAELNGLAAEARRIRELVESSDSYVPQDVAAECMLMLAPLDEPGKPNTLLALVERAMKRLGDLEHIAGPEMPCGCRAVEMIPHGAVELLVWCDRCKVIHDVPPGYLAWKEGR